MSAELYGVITIFIVQIFLTLRPLVLSYMKTRLEERKQERERLLSLHTLIKNGDEDMKTCLETPFGKVAYNSVIKLNEEEDKYLTFLKSTVSMKRVLVVNVVSLDVIHKIVKIFGRHKISLCSTTLLYENNPGSGTVFVIIYYGPLAISFEKNLIQLAV